MRVLYEKQLALFEAFRRLGFTSDEIFVGYNGGNPVVVVRAQEKQFAVAVGDTGPQPTDEQQYQEEWVDAVAAWNGGMLTEVERQRLYREHVIDAGKGMPLLEALFAKGFVLPKNWKELQ